MRQRRLLDAHLPRHFGRLRVDLNKFIETIEALILIVTHNMAQARRASEECVFMLMGKVVEHARTDVFLPIPDHSHPDRPLAAARIAIRRYDPTSGW